MEAALLAHGGDVNATAAALVLGADARAEVWGPCNHALQLFMENMRSRGAVFSCKCLRFVMCRVAASRVGACVPPGRRVS